MTLVSGDQDAQDYANYELAQEQWQQSAQDVQAIGACVDWIASNMSDPYSFQVEFGYLHPLIVIQRATTCFTAAVTEQPLANGQFNCTALPECSVTCSGPNTEVLAYASYQTGCRTEWFIHSYVLRAFLSILIFVCMNLSRVQLINAICLLQWRVLTPDGFNFIGTCSKSGKPTVNMKIKLKRELQKLIDKFERDALILFVIAVLLHLPYLIVMAVVQPPQLPN